MFWKKLGLGILGLLMGFVLGCFLLWGLGELDVVEFGIFSPGHGEGWIPVSLLGSPVLGAWLALRGKKAWWVWGAWILVVAVLCVKGYLPTWQEKQQMKERESWYEEAKTTVRQAYHGDVNNVYATMGRLSDEQTCKDNVTVLVEGGPFTDTFWHFAFYLYDGPTHRITKALVDEQVVGQIKALLPTGMTIKHLQTTPSTMGLVGLSFDDEFKVSGRAYFDECTLQLTGIYIKTEQGETYIPAT